VFVAFFAICYANTEDEATKKVEEIFPAVMSIAAGAPDDWSEVDKKAFDLLIRSIVRGKLLRIPEEMQRLKRQSLKVYTVLSPLADYFNKGYSKLKNREARKFFVDEMPQVTSSGISVTSMVSMGYDFYKLPTAAQNEIYAAFPEILG
ncbi:hypothetical protein PMAYCL1PPCAC_10448, partial [Pristionchus mayeri]